VICVWTIQPSPSMCPAGMLSKKSKSLPHTQSLKWGCIAIKTILQSPSLCPAKMQYNTLVCAELTMCHWMASKYPASSLQVSCQRKLRMQASCSWSRPLDVTWSPRREVMKGFWDCMRFAGTLMKRIYTAGSPFRIAASHSRTSNPTMARKHPSISQGLKL